MNYDLTTLENGLKVVTVPMKERDSSGVAIWVRAGSRFETAKQAGVSHLLEHMLFKGTKKRTARQIKEEVEGVGGMLNAFTGEESTCYFSKLLVPHFPRALEVLADMVRNATVEPRELSRERTVILEEIRMYRDLPSHYVHDILGELLFPDQALGRPVAGTVESVSGLTRSEILGYKKKFYKPSNIVVTVSGAVRHSQIVDMAAKYFTGGKDEAVPKFAKAEVKLSSPRSSFLEKASEQTHFVLGFHGLPRFHPDRYKLGILNIILGANMSSRLFEEVREKRGLAYEVKSGVSMYQDAGAVNISAGVEASKAPGAVSVILKELSKLRKTPVSAGELRRAKDYFMSQLYMALEDTLDHLLWAGERIIDGGELPDKMRIRDYVEAVTEADVQDMARSIFRNNRMRFALIGPVPPKTQKVIEKGLEIHEK